MTKISQYTAITTLASGDLLDISQDTGGSTYATKKIDYADLLAQIQADIVFPSNNYFRAELLINSIPSTLTQSPDDKAVTGLSYTIPVGEDGDFVFYASCNIDISNSDIKPMSIVLYKNGSVEQNSRSQEYSKKNEFQTCQTTYAIQSLVAGDTVSVYLNNNDEADIDAVDVGRLLIQKFS